MKKIFFLTLIAALATGAFAQEQRAESGSEIQTKTTVNTGMNSNAFADESVLKDGSWYKMGVVETGVYRLGYNFFQNAGIDPAALDPQKIGVFGNYSGMLPEVNYSPRADDLQENAVKRVGMEDGTFDQNDYILFYAQGPTVFKYNVFERRYNHETNLYADTIYYFLTTDKSTGLSPEKWPYAELPPTLEVTKFLDAQSHENDWINILSSGKEWFGERFSGDTNERTFVFNQPNLVKTFPVHIKVQMAARAYVYTYFEVFVNDQRVIDSALILKVTPTSHSHAFKAMKSTSFFADQDQLEVRIRYISDDPNATAWLDYIELNTMRDLNYTGGQMVFHEPDAAQPGQIAHFTVEGVNEPVQVWAISNAFIPREISTVTTGQTLSFSLEEAQEQDFIVFSENSYLEPVEVVPVENQNLHAIFSADMVIVAPEMFLEQAQHLADLHLTVDRLNSVVVTPEQIYNEFSSGSQDVTAIRDFMRMLYEREAFGDKHGYLLLFGDASFDYKHRIAENTNIVPTYESLESLSETASYVTDDYFGLLDEYEGGSASGVLDIGIGRFPVSTEEQAWMAVGKVEDYLLNKPAISSDWRTSICFVADDQDSNLHLKQAEGMAAIADTLNAGINVNKIYSDAFVVQSNSAGYRYPEVNKNIIEQVEKGTVILNYTGHGGLIGWSEEMILDVPTINAFTNVNNLPLFITATCEFSRFDDPEFTSAGEYVYLNPHGGAIALLTTTRLAYAHANIIVNTRIYDNLFVKVNGENPRLGDLIRKSKNPSNANYLNFVLLGDPALQLAFPQAEVVTTSVSSQSPDDRNDTIRALSAVSVSGYVADENGLKDEDFNGFLYPVVYDKKTNYTTLGNLGSSSPYDFQLFDRVLYKGKVSVVNGEFTFDFMVPKDISYAYGQGRISYYALDTITYNDAWGGYQEVVIGGQNQQAVVDVEGPVVEAFLNDPDFKSGDEITSEAMLYVRIFDPSGLNYTGNGIGRDITLTLDEDYANAMVLNDHFAIDLDSYQQGIVQYPLSGLSQGLHSLTLKAWDLQNNSSEITLDFYVNDGAPIEASQVLNYPNPFSDATRFELRHNKPGVALDIAIEIFDLLGNRVATLNQKSNTGTSMAEPIYWDGTNDNGAPLRDGLYLYNVIITDANGNITVRQQKLLKSTYYLDK